ncbi:MAG: DUF3887 domain-containing protein [Eubacterium sp.]|nr:DUF3887 domain-containing protein [Eubacterium sp.]
MNDKQYVRAIVRRIRCGGKKKKEIRKQLLADIDLRVRQGESIETVISGMGSIAEVADSFNETILPKEQKQYSRNRRLKIIVPVVLILICLVSFIYWLFPKGRDIADSKIFDQAQVEEAMKHTIELLDARDYASLQKNAALQMQSVLNDETLSKARNNISDNWGERKQFGTAYIAELVQGNAHYAVGEITVSYENVSVTYRLTYNQNMQFAGIYIR